MNRIFFVFSVLLSFQAYAGPDWAERGNGGDVISCNNSTHIMYDVFESHNRYGLIPKFPVSKKGVPTADPEKTFIQATDIAQQLIDRLKILDPTRWSQYSVWLANFKNESSFINDIDILDVPDTGIGFIPKNCSLKQLVVQRQPKFPHDKRYIISNAYWSRLDAKNQAAGLVHEIIYREASSLNPELKSSEGVRYFNALILSDEISVLSPEQYQYTLKLIF